MSKWAQNLRRSVAVVRSGLCASGVREELRDALGLPRSSCMSCLRPRTQSARHVLTAVKCTARASSPYNCSAVVLGHAFRARSRPHRCPFSGACAAQQHAQDTD